MRTSSGQSSGRGGSRSAACGSTPAGSRTRCRPTGLGVRPLSTGCPPSFLPSVRKSSGVPFDTQDILWLSWHVRNALHKPDAPVRRTRLRLEPLMSIETSIGLDTGQPYPYRRPELVEPDWTRFPGWKDVTADEWESVQWQRAHCIKNVRQLRALWGDLVDEAFYADLERDQAERATMSMLVPPQMMNTMAPHMSGDRGRRSQWTDAMYADPVRRYMLPVFSDRRTDWPSHPHATRDSLHEHDMWVAEGLTHRYPTKVLAELLPTCPQYCGHCTRMDLVGNSTPVIDKLKFLGKPVDRHAEMLDYLRRTPSVRDVVVSGGDVANMPWARLEEFLTR